jgi:hypothetical protein
MKSNKRHVFALAVISLIGSGASTQAALTIGDIVSVNFSSTQIGATTPTGAAVIGASGDTWNNITGTNGQAISGLGSIALNKVDGVTASGVSVTFTAGDFNGSGAVASNLDVFEGNIYITGATSTITLTGLGAGTMVDLYFYLAAGHTAGEGGTMTIDATSLTATDPNASGDETAYTLGANYVKFDDLVVGGSGNVTATWAVASGQTYSSFAGMQIAVVPEPSTALLGGLGMLALLRRRRA